MRLIDADKFEVHCRDGINEDGLLYVRYADVMESIRNAPTIDILNHLEGIDGLIETLKKYRETASFVSDETQEASNAFRWTSVNDALPKEFSPVLIATAKGVVARAYMDFGKDFRVGIQSVGDVTHWMPMPEPPNG